MRTTAWLSHTHWVALLCLALPVWLAGMARAWAADGGAAGDRAGPVASGPFLLMVTGLDADALAASLMPGYRASGRPPWLSPAGVVRTYVKSADASRQAKLTVGVFGSPEEASRAAAWSASTAAVAGRRLDTIGAESALLYTATDAQTGLPHSRVQLQQLNVFITVSWPEPEQETVALGWSLVEAIRDGASFLSKGRIVAAPMIADVGLPATVAPGTKARGEVRIEGVDMAGLRMAACQGPGYGAHIDPGPPPVLQFSASDSPHAAGRTTVTIVVATPANVVAVKEVAVVVAAEPNIE